VEEARNDYAFRRTRFDLLAKEYPLNIASDTHLYFAMEAGKACRTALQDYIEALQHYLDFAGPNKLGPPGRRGRPSVGDDEAQPPARQSHGHLPKLRSLPPALESLWECPCVPASYP
jgi:hypothetical protein